MFESACLNITLCSRAISKFHTCKYENHYLSGYTTYINVLKISTTLNTRTIVIYHSTVHIFLWETKYLIDYVLFLLKLKKQAMMAWNLNIHPTLIIYLDSRISWQLLLFETRLLCFLCHFETFCFKSLWSCIVLFKLQMSLAIRINILFYNFFKKVKIISKSRNNLLWAFLSCMSSTQ